ncbi:MAG: AAA family ATPase, partial [Planctomycetaceae bacterium]
MSLGSLFKGRSDTLQQLHRTLVRRAANKAVITANQTIAGLGGVGKTRLTLEYAWQYGSEYSARLYVKADSPASLRQNLAELAVKLEVPVSNNLEEQLQAVLEWLHTNTRWLLILDNVDTEDAKHAVLDLLPQLTSGHVLITSRLATWTGTTDQITLDVLSEPAAVEFLLERTAGQRSITDSDTADATLLSRQLGHLPLALEQAGAFIAKNAITFAAYSQRWHNQEQKVLGWNKDLLGRYDLSVLTTWAVTFGQLDSDGRGLLHLLCWLAPDPIPTAMIEKQTAPAG